MFKNGSEFFFQRFEGDQIGEDEGAGRLPVDTHLHQQIPRLFFRSLEFFPHQGKQIRRQFGNCPEVGILDTATGRGDVDIEVEGQETGTELGGKEGIRLPEGGSLKVLGILFMERGTHTFGGED